jgi:hypothetical protein
MRKLDTLRLGRVLADQDADRIADIGEQGEGDESHHEQDWNRLKQP